MDKLAEHFLSKEEKQKVTDTVQQAELQTSGEIVPMIVSRSYTYPKARLTASLFLSIPLTFLITHILSFFLWINPNDIFYFGSVLLPLSIITYWLQRHYSLLTRLFISKAEMEHEVEEEAIKSFFNERLYKTRDNNGILLFISVFEKKAWILADFGINEKIPQKKWDDIMTDLTSKIAKNDPCQALCYTIQQIGDILVEHFPQKKDDTNELHNLIVR